VISNDDRLSLDLFGETPALDAIERDDERSTSVEPSDEVVQPFLFDLLPAAPRVDSATAKRLYVHFETFSDVAAFAKLVGQPVTSETRAICYPAGDLRYVIANSGPSVYIDEPEDEILAEFAFEQNELFGGDEWWVEHWRGMPEFVQNNLHPIHSIEVWLRNAVDRDAFGRIIGQKLTAKTRSVWYPETESVSRLDKRYVQVEGDRAQPRYPIYIISKGRWESRQTARELDRMRVPYTIVVEPQEASNYFAVIDAQKIVVLPFSNLGQGSIPARNFVWEHALSLGVRRHWILDDNIMGFYRLHNNMKIPTQSGVMFRAAEDFVDRYENVALAGFQYWMFAPRRTKKPPFYPNARIYSCILIDNALPYRWRGRYNEDTDLSLRALKDGWATVLFYAFIADKTTTLSMKGGNTDELYANVGAKRKEDDGRWLMAESLRQQHPDVTKITWKWGRWQHSVDYSRFRVNKLKLKEGLAIPEGFDNYGMRFERDA